MSEGTPNFSAQDMQTMATFIAHLGSMTYDQFSSAQFHGRLRGCVAQEGLIKAVEWMGGGSRNPVQQHRSKGKAIEAIAESMVHVTPDNIRAMESFNYSMGAEDRALAAYYRS